MALVASLSLPACAPPPPPKAAPPVAPSPKAPPQAASKPEPDAADLALERQDYAAAEQLLRDALSTLEAQLGRSHPRVAVAEARLAALLLDLCRHGEAEPLLQHALEVRQASPDTAPRDVAGTWRQLAEARWIAKDDAGAESSMQKAISLLSEHEKSHAELLIDLLHRLADMFAERDMPAEVRAARERAVAVGERSLGASSSATVDAAAALWELHRDAGDTDAADKLLLRLAIVRLERSKPGYVPPPRSTKKAARCVPAPTRPTPANTASAAVVVRGMGPAFRDCYNKVLKTDPALTGRIRVTVRIDEWGAVASTSTFAPAGSMVPMAECALETTFQSKFSPPGGPGATIIIPLTLVSQ